MLSFSHVTKVYGKRKNQRMAVDDFSLNITAPIFGFLGQNGAGKTTIMKMVTGLLLPTSGTITLGGVPSSSPESKQKMGFMPETPYFYENMTGIEFLRFCAELFSAGGREDSFLEGLLAKAGIADARDYEIRTYSKGMRQRLGFAQSLVNDPEYLFLDEPLDGLDPIGRHDLKESMLALKHEGRKIFLNTHILYDVEEICDEVGIIHEGKLLYAGSVKDFCAGRPLEERFVEIVKEHEKKNSGHSHAPEQKKA
jgi:ABC-2 type transport system ATP-binding protein